MSYGERTCSTCGRPMPYHRRWGKQWDEVRYCSRACRSQRPRTVDQQLEEAILALLEERRGGATICPAEAARVVRAGDWRPLMERARRAARRLAARGEIEVTQGGRAVDAGRARGPIRLRTRRHG